MTKADGEMIIDSKINTDGVEAGAGDINKALKNIVTQLEKISKTAQTICDKMGRSFMTAAEGVDATATSADNATEAVKKTAKEAKKAAKEIEKSFLTVTNDEGTYKLFDDGSREWIKKNSENTASDDEPLRTGDTVDWAKIEAEQAKIQQQIDESTKGSQRELTLVEEIKKARADLKKLEADGYGAGDDKYDSANKKLIALTEQLRSYSKTMVYETQQESYTLDTLEGKIAEVNATIERMKSYGGSIEDADMQKELNTLAELKERYKQVYAEATMTQSQKQKEAEASALAAEKEAEATRKTEAKIAAMNKKLEETRAKEVQAAVEAKRIEEIANSANVSDERIVQLNKELEGLNAKMKDFKAAGVTSGYEEYDTTAMRIKEIKAALKEYSSAMEESEKETSLFEQAMNKVKSACGKVGSGVKKAVSTMGKLGASLKGVGNSSKSMGTHLNIGLKNVLKYGFAIRSLYVLVNKLKSAVKEGMTSLSAYDATTASSINSINNALTRLKNSLATAFAPILNVIAPILTKFINMLSTAISYVSAFFAALTGQNSYTKAIGVTNDYADSVESTAEAAQDAADATNEAKKANDRYLSGLDEVKRWESSDTDTSGSGSGGSGGTGGNGSSGASAPQFETVAIDSKFKDLANKVKSYFTDIFKPMQEAWNKYGAGVIKSWKGALESVIKTIKTIGSTFKQVWTDGAGYTFCSKILQYVTMIGNGVKAFSDSFRNAWNDNGNGYSYLQSIFDMFSNIIGLITTIGNSLITVWSNGTGAEIIGTILQIFTNIHETIGNIALRLQEAWEQNTVGQAIIQNILDAVQAVLTFVNDIASATKEWAASIDFYPLLESIKNLTDSLAPIIETIGSVLSEIYENIILPMLTWVIETGLPNIINLASSFFGFLGEHEGLLKTITTLLVGVFAFKTISPLATGIVGCISSIVGILGGGSGVGLFGTIKGVITLFTGKGGFVGGIQAIITAMSGGGGLTSTLATVASSIGGGITTALSGLVSLFTGPLGIAVAVGAAAVLIVTHWDDIKEAATAAKEWIGEKWEGIKSAVSGAAESVKQKVSGAWDTISTKTTEIWDGVSSKVSTTWDNFKTWAGEKFDSVKSAVSGAWDTAKEKTTETWDTVSEKVSTVWGDITGWASEKFGQVKSAVSGAWTSITSDTQTSTDQMSSDVLTNFDASAQSADSNTNSMQIAVSNRFSFMYKTVQSWMKAIRKEIKGRFEDASDDVEYVLSRDMADAMEIALSDLVSKCSTKGAEMGDALVKGIESKISDVKSTVNDAIRSVNNSIYSINKAINSISSAFTFKYNVPTPSGGRIKGSVSLSLPTADYVPYLATGAVIPPNAPFTAVLGDQKHGTNIEAPESLIRKIIREEMGSGAQGGGNTYKVEATVGRRALFEVVLEEAKLRQQATGRNPLAFG